MKILLAFLLCCLLPDYLCAQDIDKIDRISIYEDFHERGYTTAGAYTHFDDMKKAKLSLHEISVEDQSVFQGILSRAVRKKHHQTKLGTRNIFCEIQFSDISFPNRVIISNVATHYNFFGKSKGEFALITNLTTMKEYVIRDAKDLEWISLFHEKVRL